MRSVTWYVLMNLGREIGAGSSAGVINRLSRGCHILFFFFVRDENRERAERTFISRRLRDFPAAIQAGEKTYECEESVGCVNKLEKIAISWHGYIVGHEY